MMLERPLCVRIEISTIVVALSSVTLETEYPEVFFLAQESRSPSQVFATLDGLWAKELSSSRSIFLRVLLQISVRTRYSLDADENTSSTCPCPSNRHGPSDGLSVVPRRNCSNLSGWMGMPRLATVAPRKPRNPRR